MNRWVELFGTPEDAAATIESAGGLTTMFDVCDMDSCPYAVRGCLYTCQLPVCATDCEKWTPSCMDTRGGCALEHYDVILEWLLGEVER